MIEKGGQVVKERGSISSSSMTVEFTFLRALYLGGVGLKKQVREWEREKSSGLVGKKLLPLHRCLGHLSSCYKTHNSI